MVSSQAGGAGADRCALVLAVAITCGSRQLGAGRGSSVQAVAVWWGLWFWGVGRGSESPAGDQAGAVGVQAGTACLVALGWPSSLRLLTACVSKAARAHTQVWRWRTPT